MARRMPLMAITAEQKLCSKAKRKDDHVRSLARESRGGSVTGGAVTGPVSWLSSTEVVLASLIHITLADFRKLSSRGRRCRIEQPGRVWDPAWIPWWVRRRWARFCGRALRAPGVPGQWDCRAFAGSARQN